MAAIYYDDECQICRDMLQRFGRTLAERRFTFVPLQSPGAARVLGVSNERLMDEMRVRLDDGLVFGGASAVAAIARRIWWAWPLWALSRVPGVMSLLNVAYRRIARNRHCPNELCTGSRRAGPSDPASVSRRAGPSDPASAR
jgi:predicted DCC family thiol-disulfide oxidoreductase YuxK